MTIDFNRPNKIQLARWAASTAGRWLLGGFFTLAGLLKLTDLSRFADTIADFGLVYEPLIFLTAVLIVVVEIASGAALIAGVRYSLGLVTAQLFVFSGVLIYGLALGLDVDCGCMGPSPAFQLSLTGALVRNVVLLGVCEIVHWGLKKPSRPRKQQAAERDEAE